MCFLYLNYWVKRLICLWWCYDICFFIIYSNYSTSETYQHVLEELEVRKLEVELEIEEGNNLGGYLSYLVLLWRHYLCLVLFMFGEFMKIGRWLELLIICAQDFF